MPLGGTIGISRRRAQAVAGWLGMQAAIERIMGNLEVSDSRIRELLGWKPRLGTIEYVRESFADQAENGVHE